MPARTPTWIRQHLAALRALLVLTVVLGIAYPLVILAVAQLPGLKAKADGSLTTSNGAVVGSRLIGQAFTDAKDNPLPGYFQSRPSAATANEVTGYDPTATSASNLGPESVTDTFDDPATKDEDESAQSLLTQVCSRSLAVGKLEHVDGSRPFCTPDGVGAVLAVFYAKPGYKGAVTHAVSINQACPAKPFITTYKGAPVTCATFGTDYSKGKIVPIKGTAPAHPKVPADAVTASGSALDPEISLAYATIQQPRVAKARGITVAQVKAVVDKIATGRDLGFMGEKKVNLLLLNIALDKKYPYSSK